MSTTDNPVDAPTTVEAVSVVGGRHTGWPLLAALSVTQTVGYGVLYYAFAVLLTPMAADLGVSTAAVTGALTLSVVVSAAAAVPVGRWLDRRGGRALMTAGSLLGTGAVLAWSQVRTVGELYAVLAAVGLASAMVLYEPAFAVIVGRFDPQRRPSALLTVTIVAGFASSVFLPLTGVLADSVGWRAALVVLGCGLAILTVAPHALFLPSGRPPTASSTAGPSGRELRRAAWRDRRFWLLVAVFTAHTGAVAVIAVHLVAYLIHIGHTLRFAATVAGLLGVLSVTGRVVTTTLWRRWSTAVITAAVFVVQAVAVLLLPVFGGSEAGAVVCVVMFGLGFGVATLARPVLLADRYGTTAYAGIAGTLALPATLAKAVAPLGAAVLATSPGGYPVAMVAVAVACAGAAGLLALTTRPAG